MTETTIVERVSSLLTQFNETNRFFADILYIGKSEKEELENLLPGSTWTPNSADSSLARKYKMKVVEVEEISYLWCGSEYLQSNPIPSSK